MKPRSRVSAARRAGPPRAARPRGPRSGSGSAGARPCECPGCGGVCSGISLLGAMTAAGQGGPQEPRRGSVPGAGRQRGLCLLGGSSQTPRTACVSATGLVGAVKLGPSRPARDPNFRVDCPLTPFWPSCGGAHGVSVVPHVMNDGGVIARVSLVLRVIIYRVGMVPGVWMMFDAVCPWCPVCAWCDHSSSC